MTRARSLPFSAFSLWTDLAMKTGEMMLASSQVIDHRTTRMRNASVPPSPRDTREFNLMVQEKAEAGAEATMALASQAAAVGARMMLGAPAQMMALAPLAFGVATSRSLPQMLDAQAKLGRAMLAPMFDGQLVNDAARAGQAAVKPFHRRATANAKRLKGKP